jgi:hypothetical protein
VTGTDVANVLCAVALIVFVVAVVYRAWVRPPARTRVTAMPAELTPDDGEQFTAEDREFIADLTDRMKRYGTAIADHYDTPEGPQ